MQSARTLSRRQFPYGHRLRTLTQRQFPYSPDASESPSSANITRHADNLRRLTCPPMYPTTAAAREWPPLLALRAGEILTGWQARTKGANL